MKVKYIGRRTRDVVPATGARAFTVESGDVVEVDDKTAASLLDQPRWFQSTDTSDGPTPAEVRRWAVAEGVEVPARGKVPDDVVAAYLAAQEAKESD